MSHLRYSKDLKVTLADLHASGLHAVLTSITKVGYSYLSSALASAANDTQDMEDSHRKVLWLLSNACSMMLSSENKNQPFKPMMVLEGKRTCLPEDFTEADIAFFAQIVEHIDHIWLKARLADIIWIQNRKLGPQFALLAIDAYRTIPLDTETWIRGGQECWPRAIGLARTLGKTASSRIEEMESAILEALDTAKVADGFLAFWLADMLKKFHMGKGHGDIIAEKLETIGRNFAHEEDWYRARDYYALATEWFKIIENAPKATEVTVLHAECLAKDAEKFAAAESPSHAAAATHYEKAIQIYRTIPRAERARYQVDERIAQLHAALKLSGELALSQMSVISSGSIDLTQCVQEAKDAVRGKNIQEALFNFVNLTPFASVSQYRDRALKNLQQHPISSLFSSIVMSHDGRVIKKSGGLDLKKDILENNDAIWGQMLQEYSLHIALTVQGLILPALGTLHREHRFFEEYFERLASHSPIVPIGRARLFGQSLFAGFDNDFATAIHILVPQIENMVRYHLKAAGAKTTTLDSQGIEMENGLSALADSPEIKQIFGDDVAFELKALFCDACGPNLRNEIAHGLISDSRIYSAETIYAWWLILKIIFNVFWNTEHKYNSESEADSPNHDVLTHD